MQNNCMLKHLKIKVDFFFSDTEVTSVVTVQLCPHPELLCVGVQFFLNNPDFYKQNSWVEKKQKKHEE